VDASLVIARLERTPTAVEALVAGLSDADWRHRPAEGKWSLLEVVNHLADEDPFDFRVRTASILEDPTRPLAPTDPEGDVARKRFNERDPAESVRRFREERAKSIAWLRSLVAPDWRRAFQHPKVGPVAAGDLLAAWPAHDARHLAQIARLLDAQAARDGAPFSTAYAG